MNIRSSAELGALRATFKQHLYLPDTASVDFVAAVMIANRMPNDPVWGMIIGPSGGGKTEAVQSVGGLPEVHQLSALSSKTLLSGHSKKSGPASLLHRMDAAGERVLVLKDFTTILSMRGDDRAEILAQLREVYDGQLVRETGMGDPLKWQGHIGFLAGVTPAIDMHHAVIGILGERFLYLRLTDVDSTAIGAAAFGEDDEVGMRQELHEAMRSFVEGTPVHDLPDPAPVQDAIVNMAIRTAWVRSSVPRDSYGNRDIVQRPSLEAPTRITKQLRQLWKAAVLMGHEDPLGFVDRIAHDSTRPADRLAAAEFIAERGQASSTAVRKQLKLPYMTNKRILEDLEALEVIEISEEGGDGKAHVWSVTEAASALFSANPTRDNGGKGERGKYIGRGGESGWGSDDYIRPDGTIDFSRLLGGLA